MPSTLITGANRGLGLEFARQYADAGWQVYATCRDPSSASALRRLADASGGNLAVMALDVTDLASIKTAAAALKDRPIDLLFNNAGVGAPAIPLEELSFEQWKAVVDTNLTGAFLCSREALKIMKPQKCGRIITIGSISSITPRPNGAAYAATKLALEGLTRSIALDYRDYNVGASIIHLGASATSWMKVPPERAIGPDYHLQLDDIGRLATFIASLPTEANMLETTILPIQQRSFIGRG